MLSNFAWQFRAVLRAFFLQVYRMANEQVSRLAFFAYKGNSKESMLK